MKKRIQNKETNFFNAVVSLAVLVGFLSIQFHSFVHHHEDIHDHSEHHDSNHLGDVYFIDDKSDDSLTTECPTCVLTKHVNSVTNNWNLLYSNDSHYQLIAYRIDFTKAPTT